VPGKRNDILILGIGNDFRGDDGFGLVVARQLRPRYPGVPIHLSRGDATELLDYFDQTQCLLMIDAIYDPGTEAGHLHHIDFHARSKTVASIRSSTHLVSITEAIELGRLYDRLPQQLHLFGVTATIFDHGTPISDKVQAAIEPTCDTISPLIEQRHSEQPPT
jgi:hydrogenase maturation protease